MEEATIALLRLHQEQMCRPATLLTGFLQDPALRCLWWDVCDNRKEHAELDVTAGLVLLFGTSGWPRKKPTGLLIARALCATDGASIALAAFLG